MKGKFFLIILLVVCCVLGFSLFVTNNKAKEEKLKDVSQISRLSNDLVAVQGNLAEQKTVNVTLEGNLSQLKAEAGQVSNKLSVTEATLNMTETSLKKAQEDAKVAAELAAAEVAKRDSKIKELEGQNDEMTKKMVDLNGSIGSLEKQIADTETKLAASEGDRAFLMKELKRLQFEKAELERQFNDLAVLRDQVRKLKEELSIAKRLDWIRRGFYASSSQKGAEVQYRGTARVVPATNTTALNVELRQDGAVKVQTNAPVAPAQK
jgi:septal ring factor EnvC (AmiA/AmiB activator)